MRSKKLVTPIKFGYENNTLKARLNLFSTSVLSAAFGRKNGLFLRNLMPLAIVGTMALTAPAAHAQIVFNGVNSSGTVSGGIDLNGDGVFDDGTYSLVHDATTPIRAVNFPADGGIAMRYSESGRAYIVMADFTATFVDPEVTFQLALEGNEGQNQRYEAAALQYEVTWVGGSGLGEVLDPSIYDQINDATIVSLPNFISINQNSVPTGGPIECTSGSNLWRSQCLEWSIVTPGGVTSLGLTATGGTFTEGYRFNIISFSDLVVNKTISQTEFSTGEAGFYTIDVTNENIPGNSVALNTRLQDLLPAGVTFTSASISTDGANSGGSYESATGEWVLDRLSLGETASLQINFTVDFGTNGNTVVNVIDPASITSTQTDPSDNNTSLSASFSVVEVGLMAEDSDFTAAPVLAGAATPSVFAGDSADGMAPTSGTVDVSLTDTGGLTGVTINPDGTINIPTGATPGDYTLTYEVCEAGSTTNCSTATVTLTVGAAPSLSMTKVADNAGPYLVGDVVTYTYTVVNNGDQVIRGVAITDTHNGSDPAPVPGNETLLTDAAPTGNSTDAAVDGSWDVLAPGDVLTFTGTYTITQSDAETL